MRQLRKTTEWKKNERGMKELNERKNEIKEEIRKTMKLRGKTTRKNDLHTNS